MYGNSNDNDLNLCSETAFNYKIKGDIPDLNTGKVNLTLIHEDQILPDLDATISIIKDTINIKWTFADN